MTALTLQPRDPSESGRSATPLELFFDLVFVIAVAVAGVALHHELAEAHVVDGVASYAMVFFAIWWAWMNFTWFATSFDSDDPLYRALTVVQMGGVLVLAAGIEPVFEDGDLTLAVLGYVVMRVPLTVQWLRAARGPLAATARAYAAGVAAVQVLWLLWLLLPDPVSIPVLLLLVAAELAVPVLAERRGTTPWHPHHITERYGLFTIILLGESLLASANALLEAREMEEATGPLLVLGACALVSTACLWWVYFWPHHHEAIRGFGASLRYGYLHYLVFAAAGALSAGLEVQIDAAGDHTELGDVAASLTLTVPIALFLVCVWGLVVREQAPPAVNAAVLGAALAVLLVSLVPGTTVLATLVLVALTAVLATHRPHRVAARRAGDT